MVFITFKNCPRKRFRFEDDVRDESDGLAWLFSLGQDTSPEIRPPAEQVSTIDRIIVGRFLHGVKTHRAESRSSLKSMDEDGDDFIEEVDSDMGSNLRNFAGKSEDQGQDHQSKQDVKKEEMKKNQPLEAPEDSISADTETEVELDVDCLITKLLPILEIKSANNSVPPVDPSLFFKTPLNEVTEIKTCQETVERAFDLVIDHIPPTDRDVHFQSTDPWYVVPKLVNQEFKTNCFDADSARMYEVMMVVGELLFPTSLDEKQQLSSDVCFLVNPGSSGVVAGLQMFAGMANPHVGLNWKAYTRHPWREDTELDEVVVNDNLFLWEKSKWKFALQKESSIQTNKEVRRIVQMIKADFPNKLDIFVADLSCGKIKTTVTYDQLQDQMNQALLTESGQIEVALRTLKPGGHLILSVANAIEPKVTLGNLRLLAGLFSKLWIVPTRPSSSWIRPVMVVCSGYLGKVYFTSQYPRFNNYYLRSIEENLKDGEKVFLGLASFPNDVQRNLITMAELLAKETRVRTPEFILNYTDGREDEEVKQAELAEAWLNSIKTYVNCLGPNNWEVFQDVHQVTSPEELELLKEQHALEVTKDGIQVETVMERLLQNYADRQRKPPTLNAPSYKVPIQRKGHADIEKIPKTVIFSRFTSLQCIYDRMMLRDIWHLPLTKRNSKGGPTLCSDHDSSNVFRYLTENGFELDVDMNQLRTTCLFIPVVRRLGTNDTFLHRHLINTLLDGIDKLQRDDYFYVCKFPLWTRLLIGIFCIVQTCFKEARLVASNRVTGVLFKKFRGLKNEKVDEAITRLKHIRKDLDRPMGLEVVPLSSIMSCFDLENLFTYNDYLMRTDVTDMIKLIE